MKVLHQSHAHRKIWARKRFLTHTLFFQETFSTLGTCDLWSCCSPRGEFHIQAAGEAPKMDSSTATSVQGPRQDTARCEEHESGIRGRTRLQVGAGGGDQPTVGMEGPDPAVGYFTAAANPSDLRWKGHKSLTKVLVVAL